ncbi:hypothetical protein BMA0921 [Burkholderia mallei ATCC 23344]|uniref:Uncharacterized protein n=1 Tax=Burkholderia mallei (strain ATCC 23344) TaxID=243160 RepID=A0A0H2WHP5_BURMA|nr:hypothetical protein BMA0921 [Burkholderia mallei ATCC 23344]
MRTAPPAARPASTAAGRPSGGIGFERVGCDRTRRMLQRLEQAAAHVLPCGARIVRLPRRPGVRQVEHAFDGLRAARELRLRAAERFAHPFGKPRHLVRARIRIRFQRGARMAVMLGIELDALDRPLALARLVVRLERYPNRSRSEQHDLPLFAAATRASVSAAIRPARSGRAARRDSADETRQRSIGTARGKVV